MRVLWLVIATVGVLTLVGCGGSAPETPSDTIAPASAPEVAVEDVLLESGDLPEGFAKGERPAGEYVGSMWENIARPDARHEQWIALNGENRGSTQVFLYGAEVDARFAYGQVEALVTQESTGQAPQPIEELGEQAALGTGTFGNTDLAFRRCNATVYIRLSGLPNISDLVRYARRLDERLTPVVCD